jgi:hypothetical protein
MNEFLHHALGHCGEAHLNLWHTLLAAPLIGYIALKYKLKKRR